MTTRELDMLAVMVTPKFVDRIQNVLLGVHEEWLCASEAPPTTAAPRKRSLGSCRVVSTPDTEKMSKIYVLLLFENSCTKLKDLHPMVRQNISWGVTLTHEFTGDEMEEVLIPEMCAELLNSGFDRTKDCLRAHTFPKELSESVCRSLQQAAGGSCEDPFEGPIPMTASMSKCTHVVTVIRHETGYMWNIEGRASHFAARFNHRANEEIMLEPTDSGTGKNLSSDAVPSNVPVSRAYYKLRQVHDEILITEFPNLFSNGGIGVDLGASPGGWTQVLKHIGLDQVVSVDRALLAERVLSLPGVIHVPACMSSAEAAEAIKATKAPVSLLVCDACIFSGEILEKTIELMQRLDRTSWTLPACLVITLKMPYKSVKNMARKLESATKKIPSLLKKAACIMYKDTDVKIRYQIPHLMANSEWERTLVAVFGPAE